MSYFIQILLVSSNLTKCSTCQFFRRWPWPYDRFFWYLSPCHSWIFVRFRKLVARVWLDCRHKWCEELLIWFWHPHLRPFERLCSRIHRCLLALYMDRVACRLPIWHQHLRDEWIGWFHQYFQCFCKYWWVTFCLECFPWLVSSSCFPYPWAFFVYSLKLIVKGI